MKKLFIVVFILLLTGCKSSNIIECTMESPKSFTDYTFSAKYSIYKDGDYVKSITSIETYTADDVQELNNLKEEAETMYKAYNDRYGGYVYSFTINNNTLESKVIVNYDVMNYTRYLEDNPVMANYTKNNRFTVDGAKAMYALLGAKCN